MSSMPQAQDEPKSQEVLISLYLHVTMAAKTHISLKVHAHLWFIKHELLYGPLAK